MPRTVRLQYDPRPSGDLRAKSISGACPTPFGSEAGFVRLKFLAVILVGISLGLGWAIRGARFRSEAKETSSSPVNKSEASTAPPRTRLDVIRDFLKSEWPQVEARFTREQLVALEEPFLPAECPPWPEVEPLIRMQIREGLQKQRDLWIARFRDKGWPKSLTSAPLNPKGKDLLPKDLEKIQRTVDEINTELEPLAALAFDLLVEAEEAIWDQRLYQAYPFVDMSSTPAQERSAQLLILEKWKNGAWTVSYTVDSSEWPKLDEVLNEMTSIAARREAAIASYIASN